MVKEDVISDSFLFPCSALYGSGADPCLQADSQPPVSAGFWLWATWELVRRWGLQAEGRTQDCSLLWVFLQHGCISPVAHFPPLLPRQVHWGASYCPVTLALGSENPTTAFGSLCHCSSPVAMLPPVWLPALLSPLYPIPCIDFSWLKNGKVVSLLAPNCYM